jgi:hypothetical protein
MTTSDLPLDGGEASLPHRWVPKEATGLDGGCVESPPPMRLRITGLTIAIDGCGKMAFRFLWGSVWHDRPS